MTKRMLIDATHAEETRVVVLDGNRLEDFDVETSTKKQLKGNIYLAKVVRVEPSLQAAFVEYGGGRHGFLAFSEIHPDYYQIPVADRQRLLAMQAEEAREDEEDDEDDDDLATPAHRRAPAPAERPARATHAPRAAQAPADIAAAGPEPAVTDATDAAAPGWTEEPEFLAAVDAAPESPPPETAADTVPHDEPQHPPEDAATEDAATDEEPGHSRAQPAAIPPEVTYGEIAAFDPAGHADPDDFPLAADMLPRPAAREPFDDSDEPSADQPPPETIGGESDASDELRTRRAARFLRNYRIQEVIRRRQIMLVQVVKEERGTKGAALTTYISLAGRFCVLMPNSPRGGGISRKITSAADRKRLKEITTALEIPQGMGLIVRTAGANRPKAEITRDCEYLMRLWDDIREHTMRSVAPALIYEEASLIKRAIRDVYSRDIDEITVDGEEGWRGAHEFMRMLMPSHARKVQLWRDPAQSLFGKYQVEAQLDAMLSPTVQLRSGGYLVINQAEALVAIDVNSGRSTRERGIEETAVRTNLEAADEVARQLRLRDLAGLIVIDFIDMESKKNNASVERRLKDALKTDRARIQVGHISHFGLLEMSRQRLRPSLAETSFVACPHCSGLGHVRSLESSALHVLRAIEDEGAKGRASLIQVFVASAVIMYVLNHKRDRLAEIETRAAMRVQFTADEQLVPPQVRIERLRAQLPESERPVPLLPAAPAPMPDAIDVEDIVEEADEVEVSAAAEPAEVAGAAESREESNRRRRRRRRRRGGRDAGPGGALGTGDDGGAEDGEDGDEDEVAAATPSHSDYAEQPEIPRGAFPVVPEPVEPAPPRIAAPPVAEAIIAEAVAGDSGATAAGTETDEAGGEESDQARRRRGRRGGRRRRRDGTEMPAETVEAAPLPVWTGPTPADPFGGQTYDIFDLIEQHEQQEQARPVPQAVPELPVEAVVAVPAAAEPPPEEPAPAEAVVASPEPAVVEAPLAEALIIEELPEVVPAAAASAPEPEPGPAEPGPVETAPAETTGDRSEPQVGAPVKPLVIGQDDIPAAQRKSGWWRR